MKALIKYSLLAIAFGIIILFLFLYIDVRIALPISNSNGIPTGCFYQAQRNISMFLFPFVEPIQCILYVEDAIKNFPYHLLLGSAISFFLYRRSKNDAIKML